MAFKIRNRDGELVRVLLPLKIFKQDFLNYADYLNEFVMPNTRAKDIVVRFLKQGFWSGNQYRIFFDEVSCQFYHGYRTFGR